MSKPFLTAVRHAIASERAVSLMDILEEVMGAPEDGLDARGKAIVVKSKLDARSELASLRRFVMPEDD